MKKSYDFSVNELTDNIEEFSLDTESSNMLFRVVCTSERGRTTFERLANEGAK